MDGCSGRRATKAVSSFPTPARCPAVDLSLLPVGAQFTDQRPARSSLDDADATRASSCRTRSPQSNRRDEKLEPLLAGSSIAPVRAMNGRSTDDRIVLLGRHAVAVASSIPTPRLLGKRRVSKPSTSHVNTVASPMSPGKYINEHFGHDWYRYGIDRRPHAEVRPPKFRDDGRVQPPRRSPVVQAVVRDQWLARRSRPSVRRRSPTNRHWRSQLRRNASPKLCHCPCESAHVVRQARVVDHECSARIDRTAVRDEIV